LYVFLLHESEEKYSENGCNVVAKNNIKNVSNMVKQIFLSDTWFARGLADASELKYVLIWNRNKETWGGESKKPCHSSEHVGYKFYKNGTFYWRIKRVFAYKSDLLFDPLYCALHSFILGKPDFPLCHFTFFY
jgi:hypothetical protein